MYTLFWITEKMGIIFCVKDSSRLQSSHTNLAKNFEIPIKHEYIVYSSDLLQMP